MRTNLKHRLLLFVGFAFLTVTSVIAQNWVWQNPLPQGNNLSSVFFPNDTTGYAVGAAGTILKTTDAGNSWTPQNSGTANGLGDVFFIDADTGYAIGGNSTILKTINGGVNWIAQSGGLPLLSSIFFTSSTTGYAVGGGGSNGIVLKTINGGMNWIVQNSGSNTYYNSVFFYDDSTGYVVSNGGKIIKTTNGGNTWSPQTSGTTNSLYSVFFTDANHGYASEYGKILRTINGGATWTYLTIFQSYELYSICFTSADTGYVVGRSGKILKTTNAGANWTFLVSGTSIDLKSVYFTDLNTGYVVGESGIMLKTTDGGINWTPFVSSVYFTYFTGLSFPDACTGYTVGRQGKILKTNNGGANWIAQNSGISRNLNSVCFTSIDTGYAVADSGKIIKTTDGGANWIAQTSGISANLTSIYFTNADTGHIVSYNGPILKTNNGGANWGFEKYSIIKDSIGTDGLFYKGVGNYYNINNPTENNSWFKSSEYDIDKRKIKYQVWNEVNGVRNYYLNERFTYNGKGLKTHYSNSTINREQDTSWIYTDFDSLLSITFIDHDLINNISKGIMYDYDYDSDNKLSRMIPTILSSGVWVQQWEFNYYYGNGGYLPDTLLVNHLGIQYQRDLSYKNISGKDSLIIKQHKDQSTNLWTTEYSHEFRYDTVGRLIRHMEWYGTPANLESESEETWSYNNNNQLLRRQLIYNGGAGNNTAYTYYSNGRVATYYYGNGDAMGNYDYEEHHYRYLPVSLPSLNAFDFLIYPNPATDNIEILINIEQKGICTIRLFNSLGQVVINQLTELPSGKSSVHIPLNSITKGLYLIGVDFGKSTLTKKLSIIK